MMESVKRLVPIRFLLSPNGFADCRVQHAELRIDRHRLPDAAAVSLAPDPGRPRDIPALILFVLRNRVEVPDAPCRSSHRPRARARQECGSRSGCCRCK